MFTQPNLYTTSVDVQSNLKKTPLPATAVPDSSLLKSRSSMMKFVIRALTMGRCFTLKRQFKELNKLVGDFTSLQRRELLGLVMRELNNAARIRTQIAPGEHLLLIPKR